MFGFGKSKRMYLDYASATPVCEAALRAVHSASGTYANPGAIHAEGVAAKRLLEHSRELIAHELAVKARQLISTSGGTEGNNLAILGFARAISSRRPGMNLSGTHWVVSAIEHPSVLECFGEVERLGGEVTFVDPDARGIISARAVEGALRPETVLVSVQWANHEIGTIQPLRDIARIISQYEKSHRTTILLHSDLGQAPLYLAPHLHTLGVDMATLDSGSRTVTWPNGADFAPDFLYSYEPEAQPVDVPR